MNPIQLRPKQRSKYRIMLGKKYFTTKRHLEWIFSGKKFANKKQAELLRYSAFTHETILMRQLKDVDLWFQRNKITNIRIAINKLNGLIIRPGETFSYWKTIGKPSRKDGYVDGMVLFYGNFMKGVGGGLCQLSNLIYWTTLHTSLTVTERHRHSFDVFPDSSRTQPFGSGATCSYNYLDLQIKNETNEPFQLHLYLTDTHLVGEWRTTIEPLFSYTVYEKEHAITPAYLGGYIRHNVIYRKKYNRLNIQIADEYIVENHAIMMYEPLLETTEYKKGAH
ncbi:VanW family protein [Bacillus sp. FJAT-49711]|uniref:VanW family protein n=1 Tax=Bacillus sp. FJAT-49711 TaxID=2833585 RepID=UPI001BCA4382|nr:VanW family protein [Bacillus sp. FJAT-49711]MBS4220365.1 VanW family protein [Bacillus sp. FJAT-49711]